MQVLVASPLTGARARLIEALRDVALPGIALAGVEPLAAGAGTVSALVCFEWGPVLVDVGQWADLDERAQQLSTVLAGGGLHVLAPCEVLALEPESAPRPTGSEPANPDGRRVAAMSPAHLREAFIDLARERFGQQRWSTADVLWTLDLMRLPAAAMEVITESMLTGMGFVPSRVPLLDGHQSAPTGADPAAAPTDFAAAPTDFAEAPTAMLEPVREAIVSFDPASTPYPPTAEPAYAPSASVPQTGATLGSLRSTPMFSVPEPEPRRVSGALIAAIVAALVIIACVVGFLLVSGGGGSPTVKQPGALGSATPSASGSASGTGSAPASPSAIAVAPLAVPAGYTAKAADTQADCAAHSYGQVATFLATTRCVRVQRQLLTSTVDARPVVFAVREVTMSSAADAASLKTLVDGTGTGNVDDLLRDGATYPGGPTALPSANDYASSISGAKVRIVEAGFTDGAQPGDSTALQSAAAALAAVG
jgi:hypothetical protein